MTDQRSDSNGSSEEEDTLEAIVTFLEMTGPPTVTAPVPIDHRLCLLRAHRIPLHFYRYLYDAVGRPWNWVARTLIDDKALARLVHRKNVVIRVLYCDGAPAGFFELLFARKANRVTTVDLCYFGLMRTHCRQGLGTYLLGVALREAWRAQPRKVLVNTCTLDDPSALTLYQRHGFRPVGRETHWIQRLDSPPPTR